MVTIGLPVYKGERWLKLALESVLAQSYTDWELIVVDDSTNGELGVRSEELGITNDKRIRIISDCKHLGIAPRLNQMVQMARGEFFARMDADDIMMPKRLEKQVAFLKEHPVVDVVSCSAIVIDEKGEKLGVRSGISEELLRDAPREQARRGVRSEEYCRVTSPMHPTVMGRTEWFRQNPYNEEYSGVEDYELWLRVKNTANICHLSEPLMYYRERTRYNIRKVWHERTLGIKMIWHERHLYGSTWRALLQILNNIMVMMMVPIIHVLHLDRWLILRRNK